MYPGGNFVLKLIVLFLVIRTHVIARYWREIFRDAFELLEATKPDPGVGLKGMGPFESGDDNLYLRSEHYSAAVIAADPCMREKIRVALNRGLEKNDPEQVVTGAEQGKEIDSSATEMRNRSSLIDSRIGVPEGYGEPTRASPAAWNQYPKATKVGEMVISGTPFVGDELLFFKSHMQVLKTWFEVFRGVETKFEGKALTGKLEKPMQDVEYWNISEKEGGKVTINDGGISVTENANKVMNNSSSNNQYLIDGIVAANRLPEGNGKMYSQFTGTNATGVELAENMSDGNIGDFLQNTRNNFSKADVQFESVTCFNESRKEKEKLDELKKLESGSSKVLLDQNITLKHINQMSKIIEFVERYRGNVSALDTSAEALQGKQDKQGINVVKKAVSSAGRKSGIAKEAMNPGLICS